MKPSPLTSRSFRAWEVLQEHRKDLIALILVLLVAAGMRFARLDAVEFFHDEAMVSMMAQEMADGQTFPLQGILSSVGIPNPPTSIYVMAVPFALSNDPVFATGYIALLNVIGVGLLWGIARKEFGFTAALVAGLIFALNPWAVMYSRKIWAQDYVNPFLLLALTAALWGYKDGKRWGQILALPLMLFAMQIHFAAWALVPLFGWIFVVGRKNIHRGAVVLSVVLGTLVMLPYLVGFAQTLQADPSRISDVLSRSGGAREGGLKAFNDALTLAMGAGVDNWVLPDLIFKYRVGYIFSLMILPTLAAGSIVILLQAIGSVSLIRQRHHWAVGFILWVALPVVVFQIALADIWPHYFVPQLPAFALLAGIGISQFLPKIHVVGENNFFRVSGLSIASITLVGAFGLYIMSYFNVMNEAYLQNVRLGEGTSGYTTPMFVLGAVRDAIPDDIDDVIVLTDGDRVWFDAEAARWPVMLRDDARCVRTLPPDGVFVAPAGRFAVITTPTASRFQRQRYQPNATTVTIPARISEGHYLVTMYETAPASMASFFPERAHRSFANGVTWTNFMDTPDGVYLEFVLPDAPDRTFYGALNHDYQIFVHLLNNDTRLSQADKSFWPGRHWCAGDTVSVWVDVETLFAPTLRVGFYRILDAETGTIQPVDVLDAMGNPAGNWADATISP